MKTARNNPKITKPNNSLAKTLHSKAILETTLQDKERNFSKTTTGILPSQDRKYLIPENKFFYEREKNKKSEKKLKHMCSFQITFYFWALPLSDFATDFCGHSQTVSSFK